MSRAELAKLVAAALGRTASPPKAWPVPQLVKRAAQEGVSALALAGARRLNLTVPPEDEAVMRREARAAAARGLALLDAVFKLKSIFKVSWKTVVYRLANERKEPSLVWRQFYSEFRTRYKRKLSGAEEPKGLLPDEFYSPSPALRLREEPEHLNASLFREDRLSRLVRRALDEDRITLSRAAELLDVSAIEMRQLAGSWLK